METVNELAAKLAVAAGWTHIDNFGAKFWHRGQCRITHDHPFPPGRIDPILDLMRERLEPMGWKLMAIYGPNDGPHSQWAAFLRQPPSDWPIQADGPDLWTALASAVLAALEKNA